MVKQQIDKHEISACLTTEDFAGKMGVCVKTVENWKKTEVLVDGRHYVKTGGVVTFPWPLAYIRLMEDRLDRNKRNNYGKSAVDARQSVKRNVIRKTGGSPTNKPRFNPDYRRIA